MVTKEELSISRERGTTKNMLIVDEELRKQNKEMVNIDDNENRIKKKRKNY